MEVTNRICPYCGNGNVWHLEEDERGNGNNLYCRSCYMRFSDEILNKINEALDEKGLESETMYTEQQMENQGNNGPIRAIVAEDVLVKLNELATGGILADEWRNVIMDAFTLIWMRCE